MTKKKHSLLAIVSCLLLLAMAIGFTSLYLTDNDTATNTVTVGDVKIDLLEPNWEDTNNVVPNQELPKDPQIKNVGINDAVVFMTVEVPVENITLTADDGTKGVKGNNELFWFKDSADGASVHANNFDTNWVHLDTRDTGANLAGTTRTYVFAYKTPISKDETTTALFDKIQVKNFIENEIAAGKTEQIKINAYGIQASDVLESGVDLTDTLSNANLDKIYGIFIKQAFNQDTSAVEHENIAYNVELEDIQTYMSTAEYDSSDYTYTNVPSRYANNRPTLRNLPNTATMTLPEGSATITFTDSAVNKTWTEQVSGDTYTLKNFIPNRTYTYSVKNSSGTEVKSGSITPTGQVRMIDGEGVTFNIRDLGGWSADGGSLKYGVLYRSGELDGYNKSGNTGLTDNQKAYFKNNLGISYEVDLQADNEIDGDNISAFGNDVDYSHWAINYYITNFYLIDYSNSKIVGALRTIAQNLQNGNVGIFHCTEGADRTATVAFILEALCGVSESDIDRDYELTSFGQNTKTRNGDNWTQMKSFIKENYSGNTLRDKVINFLEKAGITYEEMNTIRNALIDGTPETIGEATNTWSENKFSASTATLASRIKSDTSVVAYQDGWVVSDFIPVDEYKEVMLKTDRLGDFYGTWFGVAFYNENKERISENSYTQGIENTNITTSSENMTATFLSKRLVDYRGKYMRIYMSYSDLNNVEIKLR